MRCAADGEPKRRISILESILFGRDGRPEKKAETTDIDADTAPKSRYVAPEDDPFWNSTAREKDAATRYEERVQFDARREGNQLRQNEILQREIGKG